MSETVQTAEKNLSGTAWYRCPDFWFWVISFGGLLLRVEYLREFSAFPHFDMAIGPDVQEYHDRALGILGGEFFSKSPDIHAPLYSFFLAVVYYLTNCSVVWARGVQLLLNWGGWLWFHYILRRNGAGVKLRFSFLTLGMFTPALIFHQGELISETLLVPLLAAVFHLLCRPDGERVSERNTFFAGLFCGLAIITHGFMWAFAFAEIGYLLWRRQWKRGVLLACGVAAIVLPVIAAKSIYYEKFTGVQGNSAFNIWLGNNPAADGGCYLRPGKAWEAEHRNTEKAAKERGVSIERIYLERIGKFYLDDPGALIRLPVKKLWKLILPVEFISGADSPAMIYKTPLQYYLRWFAFIPVILAVAGVVMVMLKRGDEKYIHFYLLAGALALAQILTVTSGRYRVGMMPGVFLLAAAAAAALTRRQIVVGIIALAGMLVTVLPTPARVDAEERSIIGEVYFRKGEFEQAERALTYASELIDDQTRFGNMLGIIAEKRGDFKLAEKFYRQALDEFNPQGHFNLGFMLSKNFPERREEANALLFCGLQNDKTRADAWNQLGINFVYSGEWKLAEQAFAIAVELTPEQEGYRKNLEFVRGKMAQMPGSK